MDKAGDHSSQNNMYKDTVSWEWRADFWGSEELRKTRVQRVGSKRAALRGQHEAGGGQVSVLHLDMGSQQARKQPRHTEPATRARSAVPGLYCCAQQTLC